MVDHDTDHNTINGTKTEPDHDSDNGDDDKQDDEQDIPYNATGSKNKSGLTVMLKDDKNFCIFLPSSPGNRDENNGKNDPSAISDSEKSARVFCSSKTSQHAVPGGKPMPKGFIKSATFASDPSRHFVQVTGSIDRDAYALSPKDGGGQYDNHGAGSPPESQCIGYPYFVALVEPDINHFCIRCCQWYSDCHAGRSAYGCQRVVPELPPDDL
ncbi:hypothetical protein K492DRAFT_124536 [Lichtheimia hyalospora FSU 10163]|nr:hypothetical protein K492DRAFT_124536 [Lichtheimia hyalospora FSU 10163]